MEMIISIKKGVFTQQLLFMVVSVLKIKGQLIAYQYASYIVTIRLIGGPKHFRETNAN
jgi:hypothetical protein